MSYGKTLGIKGKFSVPNEAFVMRIIETATKGNEVTAKDIVLAAKLKRRKLDGRDVQGIIEALRLNGAPICANGKGYYWPKDAEERHGFVTHFGRRLKNLAKVHKALKGSYGNIGGFNNLIEA